MAFGKEDVTQTKVILNHLKKANHSINKADEEVIANAVREAYGAGYENGLTDGKDISEHPISG
ncbi:MAG: hypothetical protein ACO1OC_12860 [Tuberibacillus sp.]